MEKRTHRPKEPALEALEPVAQEATALLAAAKTEIRRAYIGESLTIELLLAALLARGHVLLEGVPGIAKTTLVKTFASILGCDFSRVQFTPDLLPADITGAMIPNLSTNEFVLRRGPLFSNIILVDEINRAPAKTQSALLESMQEAQVTIEGVTEELPPPFMVLATQNPVEQEGVYILPEAQLDRFLFKIRMGYPSDESERAFLKLYNHAIPNLQGIIGRATLLRLCDGADTVYIDDELIDYIVRLSKATRHHSAVRLGASPRASLWLLKAAKAYGLLSGRTFVTPDDIRTVAPFVLEHRIILTPEAELDGVQVQDILNESVQNTVFTSQ